MKTENKNIKYVEIIAPFSGFYETVHGGKVEDTARIYYTDDQDNEIEEDNKNYQKTYIEYCKNWVMHLSEEIKNNDFVKDINIIFKDLESPKFYNFENDRLVMNIDIVSIQKIQDLIIKDYSEELEIELKEQFTPRDGYSPFYPNTTKEFLLHKQDHNTRKIYFDIFLKSVLSIDDDDLENLVECGNIDIILNK